MTCLDVGQQISAECIKSRVSGELPGKNKIKTNKQANRSFFRCFASLFCLAFSFICFSTSLTAPCCINFKNRIPLTSNHCEFTREPPLHVLHHFFSLTSISCFGSIQNRLNCTLLSGGLSKSGPLHFGPEQTFRSNFAHETILGLK